MTHLVESENFLISEIKEGINDIGICVNGGKDSLIILDLYIKNLKKLNINYDFIPCFFCKEKNCFEEINKIIDNLKSKYKLKFEIYMNENINEEFMKISIENFIKIYNLKRIILGTRQTDPFLNDLSIKEKTNNGWPTFIRLMPIYKWTYKNVWEYIELNNIEYPNLYKLGYTYLGDKNDSIPNPFLDKGAHAKNANDNIEVFSRVKYYNYIKEKNLYYNNGIIINPDKIDVNKLDFANEKYNYLKKDLNLINTVEDINIENYFILKRKLQNSIFNLYFVIIIVNKKLEIII